MESLLLCITPCLSALSYDGNRLCLKNIGYVDCFEYGYMDRVSILEIGYIYDAFPLKLAWIDVVVHGMMPSIVLLRS